MEKMRKVLLSMMLSLDGFFDRSRHGDSGYVCAVLWSRRIYADYADGLKVAYPASAQVFSGMAEEEDEHRQPVAAGPIALVVGRDRIAQQHAGERQPPPEQPAMADGDAQLYR